MRRIGEDRGRDTLLAVSLALIGLILLGCATPRSEPATSEERSAHRSEPRLPSAEADIRGTITEIRGLSQKANGDEGAPDRIGVVLVEKNPAEEAGSQKDSVTVTKATKLFEQRGQDLTQAGLDGLKVGQRARAWYTGPVAESYPRQAMARAIVIYPPAE